MGPLMGFNGSQAVIIILALTVGVLALRQLTKWKRRRDSELTSRTDCGSGEANEALRRDSKSTSRTDDESGGLRREPESSSRSEDASEEANEALMRDSESTSRTDTAFGEKYDVVLSFRGSDTRLNFTDYLYRSLVSAGIHVFLDSEELEHGEKISEVLNVVNESQIYIPVFSRNFASSPWCLRELERMVECTSNSDEKKTIIPIFYDVKADDVKLRTDLYRKAISKLRKKKKFRSDELKRWESALKTVGRIIGLELNGKRQGEQIDSIVEVVSCKLNTRHMIVTEHLVEDNAQVEAIMKLLDIGSDGVRFIGIHGMGGVGKTTLAKVMFNKLSCHFEGCCFLQDVRASSQSHDGLLNLQKKLLSSFVGFGITDQIKDVDGGIKMIKSVFSNKKVLIVLDDLDKKEQLKNLAGKSNWFCSGSRIIITTRDESILMTQVGSSNKEVLNQPEGVLRYEVRGMRFDLALHLFYKHAFRSNSVVEEYDALSREIVCTVGMLPLAVVVIGSHLFNVGNDLGHLDKRRAWDEMKKLKEGPFEDVRNTLMISYERLKDKEKEVFLDIACFFTNDDIIYPIIMWKDSDYNPHSAMRVLSHMSLVKIIDNNRFWMHNQVQDFGRSIVLREYPNKISRVWIHEEALNLLEKKERNEDVIALSLTFNGHSFTQEELACLPNLRFLRVKESDFFGNFENLLPELRWLSWQARQTTFHANNFHFSKLVVLDLSDSNIEESWGGWSQMKMNKLKVLNLTGCIRLTRTPDFSNFTSLERLILARCVELTTIHGSIDKLKRLETLNITGCSSLGELPAEIGSLESLTEIIMPQNIHPFKLPETFGDLQSLSSLILDEHPGISQLPNSIGGLVKVTHLSLRRCMGIKKLPLSIGKMKMLEDLNLSNSGIVELPDSIGCLKELKVIRVSYTMIRKFPYTIGQVEMLEELHAKKCWDLTDENLEELTKLSHLRILDLSYTEVSKFPTVRGCLSSLQTLEMSSSHLLEVRHLPPSLTHLHLQARHFPSTLHFTSLLNLDYLELSRLTASIEEPGRTWTSDLLEEQLILPLPSGLSTLIFRGISLLPPLSKLESLSVLCVIECPMSGFSISEDLINLKELKLSKCKFLEKIPGLSLLKNLERLDLNRLESLVEIDSLSELKSLLYFRISHCGQIERLPDLSKLDKLGHIELEACPKIRAIEGLESLELDNYGCTILKRLIDVSRSTWLSHKISKKQVFLSFTGSDTCYNVVDCLCKNLACNRISFFRDDEEPSSGDGIGEELPLDDSDVYLPFLSKNYASSGWRLRELVHMVECTSKSNGKKKILPIFYNVEIDDVRLESDLYRSALAKHRRKFGNEVEEWEKALREVAGMKGFDLKTKSHGELIDLVVEGVLCKLNAKKVDVPEYLVEDQEHVEALIKLLDVDSGGVRFVGIHGMSGIGKTTLAKVVFNQLFSHFDAVSFLDDVRESSRHNLINLQKKLLSSFVGSVIADQMEDIEVVMNRIKRVCETRKVLIVLDNIDKTEQLQMLVGKSNWFGFGSRIIITTRDKGILHSLYYSSSADDQKQTEGILTYELSVRDIDQALRLFCIHAFKRDSPIEGFDHLAKQIIRRVGGHPLVVEMIGSYLYSQGSNLEPHGEKRRLWEDKLKHLLEIPRKAVLDILMISYKGLEDEQIEVFLDIACFFTNEDQIYPVIMWDDCNYHPHSAIHVLLQRSLIKIRDSKFWMHDQIRDLGRHIVSEKYPHKFSRVWTHEDALKLLERKEDASKIEALHLDKYGCGSYTSEQFKKLTNLRFLQVNGANFTGDFQNLLPQLRWLQWEHCPLDFTVANFHLKKLVVLTLSWSEISENWGGWGLLKMAIELKVLNLANCHFLRKTPDLTALESLEILILEDCKNLEEIHPSIGKLTSLTKLDLKSTMVAELPESIGNLQNLRILDIRDTHITKLSGAIEMLAKLQLCVKKSRLETIPLRMQREASAPSILHPRESMEKMKDEARGRAADIETSDRNYAIAAVHNVVGIDDRVREVTDLLEMEVIDESMEKMKGETSDKNYAIAAVQNVVGIDDCVKQITDLLEMEVIDEVRIIGIHGTDGIGKTTLAKAVYDQISSCFDSCSFLAEVEETTQNSGGIQFLQTKLIHDILERDREDPSFDERIELFLDIFREMKVLIVVDDVEEQSHLHAIVGDQLHWFGPGSRIIVTSQNEEVLKEYDQARTYMVGKLDDGEAFELFFQHAFGEQSPVPGYDGRINSIVNATEKLPLAIEVIGSFLRGRPIQEWEKMEESMKPSMMSSQKSTVGLEEILDICYEELDQQRKDIFLDIAFFISGVDARIALYMWPNSYLPSSNCILIPLAKIRKNNELQMHRLLRCLGKRKKEESPDPSPIRFCTQDMVLKAMNREKGIENIEARDSCILTAANFASMPAISFLKLDDAKVYGNFEGAFPSLRWFCWQRVPLDFGATNFVLTELVIFDLSWSKVTEDWGGWSEIKMEKLKVLNLTGCSDLLFTPDFSGYKDLEILILERCSRLVNLHPSIGHLKRLVSLNLRFCSRLNGLPVELGCMTDLKELFIDGTSVREIPISIGNLKKLKILSGFKCFPLTRLPSSISYLPALTKLSLDGAKISELPSSLGDLLNLRRLSLRDCRCLEKLPDSIGKMGRSLKELDISGTSISKLPDSIRNLQSLKVLRMDSSLIRAFPREIGNLTKLEELHASCCRSLKGAIPRDIKRLHHLRSLKLGHSSISSLPSEISTISSLQTLDLLQCNEIEVLPKLPPSLIRLRVSSKRMKALPLPKDLKELEELCLSDEDPTEHRPPSEQPMPGSNVQQPFIWFSRLWNLEFLQTQRIDKQPFLISFPKLRKLELSLSQIVKLKFELTDIPQLKTLTLSGLSLKEVSELPKTLSVFELYRSAIEEIKGLEVLKALKRLDISNCKIRNLNGIGQLAILRSLILADCDDLSFLDLSNLESLKVLEVRRCKMIRQIEGIEQLTSLEKLNISECPAENSVEVQNALKHVMVRSPVT